MNRFLDTRYLGLILDVIEQGIFTVDAQTRITSFNHSAERITGFQADEAIGMACSDVFRTNLCTATCPLKQSIGDRLAIRGKEVRITTRDGRSLPISVYTAPLVTPTGRMLGGVEIFRDMSDVQDLRRKLDGLYSFEDIVSRNPEMERIFRLLPLVAGSTSTVLVTGASGTGKELVARAIHSQSARRQGPFVAVNCAAVPEGLLESELFGYRKGAFTDARTDKPGRIAQAQGGTLFLDEVGDLPLALQVKLLRFLQDLRYEPLGSNESIGADVRIIAATNRDLGALVREGRFRDDLYYRLNIMQIPLPPLVARKEDIPLLVRHFIGRFRGTTGKPIERLTTDALAVLMRYDWPGNVRELENAVEHAFILCTGPEIRAEHLPPHLLVAGSLPGDARVEAGPGSLGSLERAAIEQALARNGGNRTRAARDLGIHRTTLIRRLRRLGIS
jgi:PAS domain S-box-containing protein